MRTEQDLAQQLSFLGHPKNEININNTTENETCLRLVSDIQDGGNQIISLIPSLDENRPDFQSIHRACKLLGNIYSYAEKVDISDDNGFSQLISKLDPEKTISLIQDILFRLEGYSYIDQSNNQLQHTYEHLLKAYTKSLIIVGIDTNDLVEHIPYLRKFSDAYYRTASNDIDEINSPRGFLYNFVKLVNSLPITLSELYDDFYDKSKEKQLDEIKIEIILQRIGLDGSQESYKKIVTLIRFYREISERLLESELTFEQMTSNKEKNRISPQNERSFFENICKFGDEIDVLAIMIERMTWRKNEAGNIYPFTQYEEKSPDLDQPSPMIDTIRTFIALSIISMKSILRKDNQMIANLSEKETKQFTSEIERLLNTIVIVQKLITQKDAYRNNTQKKLELLSRVGRNESDKNKYLLFLEHLEVLLSPESLKKITQIYSMRSKKGDLEFSPDEIELLGTKVALSESPGEKFRETMLFLGVLNFKRIYPNTNGRKALKKSRQILKKIK